ncbi:uncharacterized protein AB675_11346 [Cyphellophora attinorum]|uniref:Cytochrome P450 n=1 Tax=Cyphellophora attinorum TaxID=1664694 RepID=A0A0N0NM89_9EURO|nr:uncharacterized protein AB675_11346 [Phialophora attinorum]KPI39929.1 hypothetical protein AB675_11346 [Phialophora attinorum]
MFKVKCWIDASEQQTKTMNALWELSFGGGARKCIGRWISWIEMSKVISELLRRYTVSLAHPDLEWKVVSRFFAQQKGLNVNYVPR